MLAVPDVAGPAPPARRPGSRCPWSRGKSARRQRSARCPALRTLNSIRSRIRFRLLVGHRLAHEPRGVIQVHLDGDRLLLRSDSQSLNRLASRDGRAVAVLPDSGTAGCPTPCSLGIERLLEAVLASVRWPTARWPSCGCTPDRSCAFQQQLARLLGDFAGRAPMIPASATGLRCDKIIRAPAGMTRSTPSSVRKVLGRPRHANLDPVHLLTVEGMHRLADLAHDIICQIDDQVDRCMPTWASAAACRAGWAGS